MDWEGSVSLRAWLIDLVAAIAAASAVALCLVLLGQEAAALPGGAGSLLLCFSALQCVPPEAGRFRLRAFAVPEWSEVLMEEAEKPAELEPLLLDQVADAPRSGVVRLFPATPLPTAGELKQRIDAHLARDLQPDPTDDDNVVLLSADATAALRSALAELKRAIR